MNYIRNHIKAANNPILLKKKRLPSTTDSIFFVGAKYTSG